MKPLTYTDIFKNSVQHPAIATASIAELCAGAWRRSNFPESCGADICHLERNARNVRVWLKSEMESTELTFPTEDGAKEAFTELYAIWEAAGGCEGGVVNEQHVAWENVSPCILTTDVDAQQLEEDMSRPCSLADDANLYFEGNDNLVPNCMDLERELLAMQAELNQMSLPNNQAYELALALVA